MTAAGYRLFDTNSGEPMTRQALVPILLAGCALAALAVPALSGIAGTAGSLSYSPTESWIPAPSAEPTTTETPAATTAPADILNTASVDGPAVLNFQGRLDRTAVLQSGNGTVRMELVITSVAEPSGVRIPTDLLVVMDQSGSMGGEKIAHAKAATQQLIQQLGPEDRFGLVTFADGPEVAIPLVDALADRTRLLNRVGAIRAGGGTEMVQGLASALNIMGERTAGRAGRVVLISDGLPNGGVDVHPTLVGQAMQSGIREVPLTAVGVGDDFDESLMTRIADAGTGNYHYLQSGADLAQIFSNELSDAAESVASGLTVSFPKVAGVTLTDAAGLPLQYDWQGNVSVQLGSLYAGQERRIWVTFDVEDGEIGEVALPTARLQYRAEEQPGVASLAAGSVTREANQERWLAAVDQDAWTASVVNEEYNGLKTQVATAVKQGDESAALAAIDAYRSRNYPMNEFVQSALVADNLTELELLAVEVEESFEGADQVQKQNTFSKSTGSSAYQGRRSGQTRGW